MKFCPGCGRRFGDDIFFCNSCNQALKKLAEDILAQESAAAPVQPQFATAPVQPQPATAPVQQPMAAPAVAAQPIYVTPVQQPVAAQPMYVVPVQQPGGAPAVMPVYAQPQPVAVAQPMNVPVQPPKKHKDNYKLWKNMLLSLITLGIYDVIELTRIGNSVNTIAGKYDGKRQMSYCVVYFVFSWLTIGIVPIVWYHVCSRRIGAELRRRNINYGFGAKTFWLWSVLGCLIIFAWFVYKFKLFKAMNMLAKDFNERG